MGYCCVNKRAYDKREKTMGPLLFLLLSTLTTADYDKAASFIPSKCKVHTAH